MIYKKFTGLFGAISIVVLMAFWNVDARAGNWRIEPQFRVGVEKDDNAALSIRTDEEANISGLLLDASAEFKYSSPTTVFSATPRIISRDYGDPEFDSDDKFFRFNYRRDGKSSIFRFRGDMSRELVRTAERIDTDLDIDDPDEIPVDDSGRIGIRDNRDRFQFIPDYTYKLSSVSTLGFGLNYTVVAYDEGFGGFLNDYTDLKAKFSYRRTLSERNTAIYEGTYLSYDPENRDTANGYALNVGVEHRLSEKTVLRVLVGGEVTEVLPGQRESNPVANISLIRRLETITLLAQYQRVISGGGGGSLATRDILNLNLTRRLNDKISAGLGVRAYSTTPLQGTIGIEERDYVQLRARFIWNLSRTIALEANYRFTLLQRTVLGDSANSNNIVFSLNWRPSRFSNSK